MHFTSNTKIQALANYLECDDVDLVEYYENVWEYDGAEYLVLEEHEAAELFSDMLDEYIDDCVLDQLPEQYRPYFDRDMFKRDVELSDGRGPTISGYDGHEDEYRGYFIYRMN